MRGLLQPASLSPLIIASLIVAAAFSFAGRAAAQSLNFAVGGSDGPIEITSDNGIEWKQDSLTFIARGNARATRGKVSIYANSLRAYYRELKGGGTDIWRIDAKGKVRITSPGETVSGETGIYDVDNAILVVKGKKVRFTTNDDRVTANRQLEYWDHKKMAVARGNASAVRGNKRIRADVLAAYFHRGKNGKTTVYRIEAFGNVRIATKKGKVHSDKGIYNVESGIATLTGSVTITQGSSRISGCSAKVNLNNGISKIFSCGPTGSGGTRVRGTIRPHNLKKK